MRTNTTRKILLTAIVVCACILIGLLAWILLFGQAGTEVSTTAASVSVPVSVSTEPEPEPEPEPIVSTVSFSASGDNLIHDGLFLQAKSRATDGGYDFSALYENVASFFQDYDINWINQETLITDAFSPSGYPMFCSPTDLARDLYDIGFNVFSLSNNHSYDKYAEGMSTSLAFWDTMPDDVVVSGLYNEANDNIAYHTVNDITIAYLSYTEHTNGINTPTNAETHVIYTSETELIQQQIEIAKQNADVVICCVHMGTENSHVVSDAQRTLGQQLANWGADVILGTHPHVVQPIEYYTAEDSDKQVPFFYCLGNFVSAQAVAANLVGIVATFDIVKTVTPENEVTIEINNILAHPLVMHYDANYANLRVYWAEDYTDELAASHGCSGVSLSLIDSIISENISPEFLVQ